MPNVLPNDRKRASVAQTLTILALALLLFGVLGAPLLHGKIYTFNDLGYYHFPIRDFYQHCLLTGDSFAWMPSICCGYFVHAEGQAGMYHPLHWVLYRFLPLDIAFNIEFLWSFPFMFVGLYLTLRRWKLAPAPCLFGAFTFTYSGFCLLHSIHTNMLQVAAHIPWLLLAIDHALTPGAVRRSLWKPWIAITLLTASQLLLGFPQSVYLSLIAEGSYAVLLIWTRRPNRALSTLGLIASAKALALLVAGVQVLPSLELMLSSDRGASTQAFRTYFSLHPANLIQFLGPYFFQRYIGMNPEGPKQLHEAGLYPGAAAVLLTIWVVMRLLRREPVPARELAIGALVMLVLGATLALGRYGGLYPILSHLPIVSGLRAPNRHIVLVHLAMAILSGIAFAGLVQAGRANEILAWKRCWPLLLPALAAWLLAGYLSLGLLHRVPLPASIVEFLVSPHELWIAPMIMSFATGVLLLITRGRPRALLALVIFAAADQAFYAIRYPATDPPMTLADYRSSIPVPPENDGHRVYAMVDNLPAVRGFANCVGYVTEGILRQTLQYSVDNRSALRMASVRWADARWPKLGQAPEWTEVDTPVPYVRLVNRVQLSADPNKDARTIDVATTALTSVTLDLPSAPPGKAELTSKRPGELAILVESPTRQLLTVAESWHRGWRARVDGHEVPVLHVNGDFMGCLVEPGAHGVQFQFEPASLAWGKALSIAGLALLALGGWALRARGHGDNVDVAQRV